jgi:hypothetical protein
MAQLTAKRRGVEHLADRVPAAMNGIKRACSGRWNGLKMNFLQPSIAAT